MSAANLLLAAGSGAAAGPQGDSTDFFSTYVYEASNSAGRKVQSGINFADNGGLAVIKSRSGTSDHFWFDTERGANYDLNSNNTSTSALLAVNMTFDTDGITHDDLFTSGDVVEWHFRKAPKFFDLTTINHTNGVQSDYDASSLGEVGMVEVKQTNGTSDWFVWHKDLTAGNNLRLNTTAAQSPTNAYVSVTGTTVSISSSAPSGDYIVYMYAHDPDTDNGIIQCGGYTGNGSADGPEINLGWEPQYLIIKEASASGNPWNIMDSIRGIVSDGNDRWLRANTTDAEQSSTASVNLIPNGFKIKTTLTAFNTSGNTYIYLAIRRPNKPPTSGTEVFAVDQIGQTEIDRSVAGFPVDLALQELITGGNNPISARLTGVYELYTNLTNAQVDNARQWDDMTGIYEGFSSTNYYKYLFKRAPGFMDVVCYEGNGSFDRVVKHSLEAPVELVITKVRNSNNNWAVSSPLLPGDASNYGNLYLDTADSLTVQGVLRKAGLTDTQYQVGVDSRVNGNTLNYIAILFATLPGISKVFSYTGNGTSQTIPCGFTSGARFILIKSTSTSGDWWLYDSLRGIVAGNDPALRLNSTAAQVSVDAIDPDSSGFIVNEEATCSINTNGVNYIGLAIA